MNRAVGIVALEGEGAFVKFALEGFAGLNARRFVVFEDLFPVDDDGHVLASNDDLLSPPLVILRWGLSDVDDVIEAGRFFPVAVSIIDLALEPGARPVGSLIFGVKVNATVRMRRCHHIDFEMEILERFFIADVEQVAAIPMGYQRAVFNFPCVWMFLGFFPTVESFAVEELNEAFFGIGCEERL